MPKAAKSFLTSSRYRKFISQRDEALEVILNRYLNASAQIVAQYHSHVEDIVRSLSAQGALSPLTMKRMRPEVQRKLEWSARMSAAATYDLFRRMRVSTYTMAQIGHTEAMSRALGRGLYYDLAQKELMGVVNEPSPTGGPLRDRLEFYFVNLAGQLSEAIARSMLLEEKLDDALDRVRKAFPECRRVKAVRRNLKLASPMKEADKKRFPGDEEDSIDANVAGESVNLSTGFVDDDAWQQAVDDYTGKYLPGPRGPQDVVDVLGEDRYAWEVEQEMVQDFVERVRDGDDEAANKNGIKDLTWVAIVDDKTDDCCLKRDGKTSTQIKKLLDGPWKNDECQAETCPAHFRCRCRMVPTSEDLPDTEPRDFGDFDEWLNAA